MRRNLRMTGVKLSFQEEIMQGYHDMPNDEPRWMLYAALIGAGFVAGMLAAQILAVL